MDIIQNIIDFFKRPEEETINKAPEGTCPGCWGFQEYDRKIRKLYHDKQIDVNNNKAAYTMIQKFVRDHIDGYSIKDGVVHICTDCSELEEGKERVEKFNLDS